MAVSSASIRCCRGILKRFLSVNIDSLLKTRDFCKFPNCYTVNSKILTQNLIQLSINRGYAKGKDRKKENKSKSVVINESLLNQVISIEDLTQKYDDVLSRMKDDFVKHFTLRSSLGALDQLPIEYEGTEYVLQDLAQIGKKTPSMYVVNFTDFPQVIPNVLKAIQDSGMGLNPQQDGTTLFIPVPKITKEHRETLAKNAKAVFIRTRDNIRDVQNKIIKTAKSKEISKDTFFSAKEQITYLADLKISEAEALLKSKQDELLRP